MGRRAQLARVLLCAVDSELEFDLPVDAMGPRWFGREVGYSNKCGCFRERGSAGLICNDFEKWEDDERERELWELGGGSLKWE